jgi:hypothetical protein
MNATSDGVTYNPRLHLEQGQDQKSQSYRLPQRILLHLTWVKTSSYCMIRGSQRKRKSTACGPYGFLTSPSRARRSLHSDRVWTAGVQGSTRTCNKLRAAVRVQQDQPAIDVGVCKRRLPPDA